MKGKRIFGLIFTLLLFLGSFLIVDQYDKVKNGVSNNIELSYRISDDILDFAYDKAANMDKDFKILEFNEKVNPTIAQEIIDLYIRNPHNDFLYLEKDENFKYTIINEKTNEKYSNKEEVNIDKCEENHICGEIVFDKSGIKDVNNNLVYEVIYNMNTYHMLDNYYLDSLLEEYQIDKVDVSVNFPTNIRLLYDVSKEVNTNSTISLFLHDRYLYHDFVLGALGFSTILVLLFIFIYPIKYVSECNPFKFISKIKAEFVIGVLLFAGLGLALALTEIPSLSISGELLDFINRSGIDEGAKLMIFILNIIVWISWFILVALSGFYFKYIFAYGIVRFLKEDTLIGSIFNWFKVSFNKLGNIDFGDKDKRNILIFILLNALIMMVICIFGPFGLLFMFIYIILITMLILRRYSEVRKDYQKLLVSTKKIASGDFDNIINEDAGIFNSLQNELNNIKDGFEKAVREETISQSMKTELITNVSHDLKTPLTGIRNYVELLNDDSLSEEKRKEYLTLLDSYTDRLGNLIEDLFEVSKVNSGNIELNLVNLDIVYLIKQAISEKEDDFNKNDLEVVLSDEIEKIDLLLDSDKTYRVFDNLLTNISKYAMPNTRVYVDILNKEEDVEIVFKNVSKSRMNFSADEIVDRFVRGDKSRSEAGSGIGLAIVQSFLEAQGAKFRIDIDGDLFKAIINFSKNNN